MIFYIGLSMILLAFPDLGGGHMFGPRSLLSVICVNQFIMAILDRKNDLSFETSSVFLS